MKITRDILPYFLIILSLSLPVYFGQGRTREEIQTEINDRQTQIEQLEKEAEQYREGIRELQGTGQTLQGEIRIYDARIKELQRNILATEQKIAKSNLEIEALEIGIADIDEEILHHREVLGEMLRTMYEDVPPNLVEFFLMQENISEVLGAMEYRRYLNEEIFKNLENLKILRDARQTEKIKQETIRKELEIFSDQLSIQKNSKASEKKERETLLKKTKNEEKKFKEMLTETESLIKKAQDEILAFEETLLLLVDPSRLPEKRSGVLQWPVESRAISQEYGNTPFARKSGFYRFHNGIDITGTVGAPVYAAEYGTIVGTGNTDDFCRKAAYGKWILVAHENNLTTLYAHLSKVIVRKGETIERGGLIGYVGSTGLTTGPHLHLTVYDGKTVRVKESNVCGPLPVGGHIDPRDYL